MLWNKFEPHDPRNLCMPLLLEIYRHNVIDVFHALKQVWTTRPEELVHAITTRNIQTQCYRCFPCSETSLNHTTRGTCACHYYWKYTDTMLPMFSMLWNKFEPHEPRNLCMPILLEIYRHNNIDVFLALKQVWTTEIVGALFINLIRICLLLQINKMFLMLNICIATLMAGACD